MLTLMRFLFHGMCIFMNLHFLLCILTPILTHHSPVHFIPILHIMTTFSFSIIHLMTLIHMTTHPLSMHHTHIPYHYRFHNHNSSTPLGFARLRAIYKIIPVIWLPRSKLILHLSIKLCLMVTPILYLISFPILVYPLLTKSSPFPS